MTEIDRIIESGRVAPTFLTEEIRNDFFVSIERKKLWTVLLDLLIELDEVCTRNNLRYFILGGTLLGAVRHKGFIPWDDDIDVCMPREEYEKLLKLQNEFKHPYFLQTPYTDPNFFWSSTKLRNSNTTQIVDMFKYQGFNQGICITIFPLDKWKMEGAQERYYHIK